MLAKSSATAHLVRLLTEALDPLLEVAPHGMERDTWGLGSLVGFDVCTQPMRIPIRTTDGEH